MKDKIMDSLKKINFQLIEEDQDLFVSYVMYNYYHQCVMFPAEFRPPKYFRMLLNAIKEYL
jgi:hypothetical protein